MTFMKKYNRLQKKIFERKLKIADIMGATG